MAKRKRIGKGKSFGIARGKCKVVDGSVTLCVSRSGVVSVKGASVRRVKASGKKAAAKKGVKTKTGKTLKKTKGAPSGKTARKAPRTRKSLSKRITACKSPIFNNPRKGGKKHCSCVIVNSSNRLSVTKLSSTACRNAVTKSGSRALKEVKAGHFLKTKRPKTADVGIQWSSKGRKKKANRKKPLGTGWRSGRERRIVKRRRFRPRR